MTLNKLLELIEPLKEKFGDIEVQLEILNIIDFENVTIEFIRKRINLTSFRS